MAKALLSHLTADEFPYFAGKMPLLYQWVGYTKPVVPQEEVFQGDVVVLTDGASFSTTAHLCALIKSHGLGILVGSETGGNYVCTDSAKDAVLKNTRLRLHYSTRTFTVVAEGMSATSGVKPDREVQSTIQDILQNRDVVMEKGLEVLNVLP